MAVTNATRQARRGRAFHVPAPREPAALTVGAIFERLVGCSRRPRFCFMLLSLLAETADQDGEAGPFVVDGGAVLPVREYLAGKMASLSRHDRRRQDLRARVARDVAAPVQPDLFVHQAAIDRQVEALVCAEAARNVSRCITDLERAGLCSRYYAGHTVDHVNRGGRRHAVYAVTKEALAALRTRSELL